MHSKSNGRMFETFLLYITLPLLFYWELVPVPKLLALVLVASYCLVRLWYDGTVNFVVLNFDFKEEQRWQRMAVRTLLVGVFILLLVVWIQPEQLFSMPAERTMVWVNVLFFYPIVSVLPQEIIYRTYFFNLVEDLIPTNKLLVFASAFAFAFLHIIYDNWWAVGLSLLAGMLFSITYLRTNSLFWVTVEHTLFGWLVFTLGFGNYFYEGF